MEKFESLNSANNGSVDPLSRCFRFLIVGRAVDPEPPSVEEIGLVDDSPVEALFVSVDKSSGSTSICAESGSYQP